jgi:hypothetical protein
MFNNDMFAWLSNPDNFDSGSGQGNNAGAGRSDGLSATDGTMFPWLDVSLSI